MAEIPACLQTDSNSSDSVLVQFNWPNECAVDMYFGMQFNVISLSLDVGQPA